MLQLFIYTIFTFLRWYYKIKAAQDAHHVYVCQTRVLGTYNAAVIACILVCGFSCTMFKFSSSRGFQTGLWPPTSAVAQLNLRVSLSLRSTVVKVRGFGNLRSG